MLFLIRVEIVFTLWSYAMCMCLCFIPAVSLWSGLLLCIRHTGQIHLPEAVPLMLPGLLLVLHDKRPEFWVIVPPWESENTILLRWNSSLADWKEQRFANFNPSISHNEIIFLKFLKVSPGSAFVWFWHCQTARNWIVAQLLQGPLFQSNIWPQQTEY